MDRVPLERVSAALVIAGFLIVVGSIVTRSLVYGPTPIRGTAWAWIYFSVALGGYVLGLGGLILDQYLKTGSFRQAILNWTVGFAVVLAVALGGYVLRR